MTRFRCTGTSYTRCRLCIQILSKMGFIVYTKDRTFHSHIWRTTTVPNEWFLNPRSSFRYISYYNSAILQFLSRVIVLDQWYLSVTEYILVSCFSKFLPYFLCLHPDGAQLTSCQSLCCPVIRMDEKIISLPKKNRLDPQGFHFRGSWLTRS